MRTDKPALKTAGAGGVFTVRDAAATVLEGRSEADGRPEALPFSSLVFRLLILLAFAAVVITAEAQMGLPGGGGEVSFVSPPPMRVTAGRQAVRSASLAQVGDEVAALVESVRPAVVHIRSFRTDESGKVTHEETGSGVLMPDTAAGRAVVVTNRHVVLGAGLSNIEVHLSDGRQLRPVEKAEDAATDMAVLRMAERDLPTARWGDSDSLRIGHFVIACGSPFGLSESFTLGIVSAVGRRALDLNDRGSVINQDFIQTDAAINPGNSGGPLVGVDGRIVGINTAIASKSGGNDGIGFSIPAELARYISGQLLRHGQVQRGFLGVVLDEAFDLAKANRLRLRRVTGAHVTTVQPSSPAQRAGLRTDDVIIQFGEDAVEDERHLIHLVSLTPPNRQVRMVVVREGRRVPLSVTLRERQRTAARVDTPRVGAVQTDLRDIKHVW